jgi:predicted metal-dependent hydrolase
MRPQSSPNYLAGYPVALTTLVRKLITQDQLAELLLQKYPLTHEVRTDKALYDFVLDLKNKYLRNVEQLSKVRFDSKLHIIKSALGTHTSFSRTQGKNLKSKREILISALFRDMPLDFLRMIAVHELAHIKIHEHDKAFYQLCQHMEPAYAQLEFDVRAYLTYLDHGGKNLWPGRFPLIISQT